jgi:hypothetical protein
VSARHTGGMAGLRARTLTEAHLYLGLLRAEGALGDADPGDPDGWTELVEDGQGWTLRADGASGAFEPFDIAVARADAAAARRGGSRFGPRVSTLIDAGQWQELGVEYVGQAMAAGLLAAGDRERRAEAELAWQFAIDVAAEALRFLPDGATELPVGAFWSRTGRRLRAADRARFTRAALTHQIETYRRLRDDSLS